MDKENVNPHLSTEEIRSKMASLIGEDQSNASSPAYDMVVKMRSVTTGSSSSGVGVASKPPTRVSTANKNVLPLKPTGMAAQEQAELSKLADEILVYCHLLDSSRKRALEDCVALRQTIKELEKLLDSARQREVNHLSYVEQQRESLSMFEKRHLTLKSRAKQLLKEAQEEQERCKTEIECLHQKVQHLETQLYSTQTLNDEQSKELQRLREHAKNTPSEKELQEMRLHTLKLTDENSRLATEKAALLDELKLQKKRSGNASSSTAIADSKKDEEHAAAMRRLTEENSALHSQIDELESYISILLARQEKPALA